jgi:two-component system, LuxR family, sensor kinase FixL
MNAAACLTLAGFYFAIWCKQRQRPMYLLFSCSAIAAAAISAFELWMLNSRATDDYEALVRWIHVPTWVLTLSFVAFVRLYMHAGRLWLVWSIYALRTLVLILNFIFPVGINFRAITEIRQFPWGGQMVSVPVGVSNPWGLLSTISLFLLLIFSVDAAITVWRRGDRRRAVLVGGSMIFGALLAWHVPLVIWGVIDVPFFLGFTYTAIVAAMGYELSNDLARAAGLVRELEISEKRLNLAADSADLGMWEWDIARDEIWITDKGRVLFGLASSEKLDFDRFRSRLHPEDRDAVLQAVQNSLRTGAEYRSEYRILLADGQMRWITGRGHVEFGRDGKPVRMRGASQDVSKRKQAELEAASQRKELAHLSRVTMVGELSGSLAHELNLPLAAILSNAQAALRLLASSGANLAEVREILKDIVSEDKRASEVIRRLRLWLKKGDVQQHSLSINRIVRDVLNLIRTDLITQNVTVDTELAKNLPAVSGDPVQLQQVLLNLVVNACDAMSGCAASERRLLICTRIEDGGGAVIVSVIDRGTSILTGKMEQIFEPFFTTKEKGMGLGLSVCRSIIGAHRGKIWATNNTGCGATFHFSLPVGVSLVTAPLHRGTPESDAAEALRGSNAATTVTQRDFNKELIPDT